MSSHVFISYASKDLKVANTLCKALEGRGFNCWISSRDVQPGENFQVAIVRAIRSAKMMLLVFTGNSNNSEEMTKELVLASQHRLIVVPLRIEDVTPSDAFAYEFATRQWIDFFADWEAAIDQLSLRISSAIAIESAATAAAAPEVLEAPHPPAAEPAPPPEPPRAAPAPEPPPVAATVAPAAREAVAESKPPPAPAKVEPAKAEAKPVSAPAPAVAPPAARAQAPAPAKAAPAKPLQPAAAAEPGARKPAPVGLFVGIGLVVVLLIGGAVAYETMFAGKPVPQPAAPPVKAPIVAPHAPPVVVAQPTQALPPQTNAVAATNAATNALAAAAPVRVRKPPKVKTHAAEGGGSTEVPF